MKQTYLHDQRGVAMVIELVLVATVLALAGLAVYQANLDAKTAAAKSGPVSPSSTAGIAASAAAIGEQESASDISLSASAETSTADELTQTDSDISNLGGSSNASF